MWWNVVEKFLWGDCSFLEDKCNPTDYKVVRGAAGGMAAIVMFCRGLANEAKRSGIRVNAITPSIVQGTPLYDEVMNDHTLENSARCLGNTLIRNMYMTVIKYCEK